MIKKAALGALAALSLAGCSSIAADNEEAYTYENTAYAGYGEARDAESAAGASLPEECFDGLLDNNADCIDFNALKEIEKSVYRLDFVSTHYEKSGKTERKTTCSAILFENGFVLTAGHCTQDGFLTLMEEKHEIEISIVADGKKYGLDLLLRGERDFALLKMKKQSNLPWFHYRTGSAGILQEGAFTYLFGYSGNNEIDARQGFVKNTNVSYLRWTDGYFLASNCTRHGDSGAPIIAFMDGEPLLIGIADFIYDTKTGEGGALKIDYARLEVLANMLLRRGIF